MYSNPFEPDPLGVLLLNDTTPRIGFWITYIFQLCTPMYQYIVGDCYAGEQLSIVVGSRCCFVVFPAHLNCHHVKFTPWAIFPLKISDFFFFFGELQNRILTLEEEHENHSILYKKKYIILGEMVYGIPRKTTCL